MRTLLIVLLISYSGATFAGIDFYNIEDLRWKDARKKAKEENKLIFIDFYTTWCVPCKRMDVEVFRSEAAGDYFNSRFISLKVDAEKGNGLSLSTRFRIKSYPTLIFLNAEGEIVDLFTGSRSIKVFLDRAKKLEDSSNHLNVLEKSYKSGERSLKFLSTYFTRLDESNKSTKKQLKEHWTLQTDSAKLEAENWSILNACVTDIQDDIFQYVVSHESAYKDKFSEKEVFRFYAKAYKSSLFEALKNNEYTNFYRMKKMLSATSYPFKGAVLESVDRFQKSISSVVRTATTTR